jgi:hypothetical protein
VADLLEQVFGQMFFLWSDLLFDLLVGLSQLILSLFFQVYFFRQADVNTKHLFWVYLLAEGKTCYYCLADRLVFDVYILCRLQLDKTHHRVLQTPWEQLLCSSFG